MRDLGQLQRGTSLLPDTGYTEDSLRRRWSQTGHKPVCSVTAGWTTHTRRGSRLAVLHASATFPHMENRAGNSIFFHVPLSSECDDLRNLCAEGLNGLVEAFTIAETVVSTGMI